MTGKRCLYGFSAQVPNRSRKTDDNASLKGKRQKKEKAPLRLRETPKWFLPAIAAVLIVALLGCSVWFISKKGRSGYNYKIAGQEEMGEIDVKKNVSKTIEIPGQPNTNYLIATEPNAAGIICSVKNKTTKSFDLVARNTYSKKRSPTITWVLIPY